MKILTSISGHCFVVDGVLNLLFRCRGSDLSSLSVQRLVQDSRFRMFVSLMRTRTHCACVHGRTLTREIYCRFVNATSIFRVSYNCSRQSLVAGAMLKASGAVTGLRVGGLLCLCDAAVWLVL